jgi:hypothetical protein
MQKVALFFVLLTGLFFSCSDSKENKADPKTEKTASATTSNSTLPVADKFGFTPYTMVVVEQPIPSFDLWLPVFNAHDADRKASGLTVLRIGRIMEDSNKVLIRMKADDLNKAKEFSKGIKKDLEDAGYAVDPKISYVTVIRDDSSYTNIKERALVSYHVKDFDSWLKIYDEKGKATRETHGLIDRGLARGAEDPNMVYILFAISDMRKARIRFNSSELRKILRNAGVDSRMTVSYYKVVQ